MNYNILIKYAYVRIALCMHYNVIARDKIFITENKGQEKIDGNGWNEGETGDGRETLYVR